jgi:predicted hotdog family 3-hydroxylacyl-ACP dehydratase
MTAGAAMLLDRLPHAGRMRLLEDILELTPELVRATASSHRDRSNPLRGPAGLAAVHAVEYAAQTAALHGAAAAADGPRHPPLRFIATVRDARFERDRLDDLGGPLEIEARLLAPAAGGAAYAVRVSCGSISVMTACLLLADAPASAHEATPMPQDRP